MIRNELATMIIFVWGGSQPYKTDVICWNVLKIEEKICKPNIAQDFFKSCPLNYYIFCLIFFAKNFHKTCFGSIFRRLQISYTKNFHHYINSSPFWKYASSQMSRTKNTLWAFFFSPFFESALYWWTLPTNKIWL